MINRFGASTLSMSRFSGSLAYIASNAISNVYAGQRFMPGADESVGSPLEVDPTTGKLSWNHKGAQESSLKYWPVIDQMDEVLDLAYFEEKETPELDESQAFYGVHVEPVPSSEINDAFQSLHSVSVHDSWDFTLSWWAKADSDPGVVELNIFSLETKKSQFMVILVRRLGSTAF